jgi:uncharacterized protein (DUF4415 family)
MTENGKNMVQDWQDPDDAPDMSTKEWQKKFENTIVSRGRPKLDQTKISTTMRLDADIIERFRAKGPGWQTRINDALREWLAKSE